MEQCLRVERGFTVSSSAGRAFPESSTGPQNVVACRWATAWVQNIDYARRTTPDAVVDPGSIPGGSTRFVRFPNSAPTGGLQTDWWVVRPTSPP